MKNFDNVLFLETRGCNFWADDAICKLSDVGNYRVGVYDFSIKAKNGRGYILEFGGYDKKALRTTNKRTGEPLKNPIVELVQKNALHIDTEFENENGSWRDLTLEKSISEKLYSFTQADILNAVNDISIKQYNEIIFLCDEEIKHKLAKIYSLGGWREKSVIDNLKKVSRKQWDKNYHVATFTDAAGNSFDFEFLSNKVTG